MKNLILVIIISAFIFTSCKKEGCTDTASKNFNAKSKHNPNICQFEASIMLWYGINTAQFLVNDGATSLRYYIDGKNVGTTSANAYWPMAPSCGQSVTFTSILIGAKSKNVHVSILDQTDHVYYNFQATITAGDCKIIELN